MPMIFATIISLGDAMIVEDKAAEVAWHLLVRYMSFDGFKRELREQRVPSWNRAVAMIADAMRDYAEWCEKGDADDL